MNQNKSPKVWYASEEKLKSRTKFIVFDDSGVIETSDETIDFKGPIYTINISKSQIKNVALVRQKINWIMYLVVNIAVLIYITDLDATVLMYLIICNILGLMINMNTKWLEITYAENGIDKKIYFAGAEMLGW